MLRISKIAEEKIQALLTETNNPKLNVRLFIVGGSCAGFQYGLLLDEILEESDTKIEQSPALSIIADPISIQYLEGAIIDYREASEGFSIHNPNVQTGCPGCGGHF